MFTGLTIFRLITAALLPVLVTVVFYLSERKNRFHNITNIPKQILIGITFGVLAILATEFGIPVDGAVLNGLPGLLQVYWAVSSAGLQLPVIIHVWLVLWVQS